MKIVFVSNYYNHHQASLCRALSGQVEDFYFIATSEMRRERRDMGYAMAQVPDFVRYAHRTPAEREVCLRLIEEADVLIAGAAPEELIAPRIRAGKLTFRYTERLFKQEPKPLEYLKKRIAQHLRNPKENAVYLLCASAYTAEDYARLGLFSGRAYRWGYFPEITYGKRMQKRPGIVLWAGRLLDWKHPDDALEAARQLIEEGYDLSLEIVGAGELAPVLEERVRSFGLESRVKLTGVLDPSGVRARMEEAEIFLFTSDRQEGWGAVLNEAMDAGCAVVASHAAGSTGYLVEDGKNGLIYPAGDVAMLREKLRYLLDHPNEAAAMGAKARETMESTWNADTAAERLCALARQILAGEKAPDLYDNGPISKAPTRWDNKM